MKVEVLISCMQQKDESIIYRTAIKGDVVVINQCDNNGKKIIPLDNENHKAILISSEERGLSKSRNMALRNATSDICLICDDDEILDDDYITKIINAFVENPQADVIAFQIRDAGKRYPKKKKKIGYIGALKLASWQLAFRRQSVISKGIRFDETLGSGVSKAGGEENKFVYDCIKKDLKVIYVPVSIGRMIEGESQWFHGFTKEYFFDRGIMTRKLMGSFWASLYAIYFLLRKYPLYSKDISFSQAASNLFKGLGSKHPSLKD